MPLLVIGGRGFPRRAWGVTGTQTGASTRGRGACATFWASSACVAPRPVKCVAGLEVFPSLARVRMDRMVCLKAEYSERQTATADRQQLSKQQSAHMRNPPSHHPLFLNLGFPLTLGPSQSAHRSCDSRAPGPLSCAFQNSNSMKNTADMTAVCVTRGACAAPAASTYLHGYIGGVTT